MNHAHLAKNESAFLEAKNGGDVPREAKQLLIKWSGKVANAVVASCTAAASNLLQTIGFKTVESTPVKWSSTKGTRNRPCQEVVEKV